ncbi:hypothetical protein [Nitrosopumilus ureiphilus]|uniref:Uncharacterized protein n=1 Tax=Nitrosopumilus ureiphilus TaxID=1470067 RepID=A0A7D5M543_9ARCH|nr:hypothetical protein [Nitrosopumilus ureiphilus]QLH07366.1 hypothetical protein C5F50_10010 [Nitrosopumilus ureiphilus]
MKTRFQKQSRESKIIYFVVGLFLLNAFGMIPVGIMGAYTAEPMKITSSKILEDGSIEEVTSMMYYHERLSEGVQNHVYEFFRYSLPVTLTGYFLVIVPDFSYDYVGILVWILSFISIPLVMKYTSKFPIWKRFVFVYFIAVQISGMWALSHVNFECISFIDYPIRPGPPCGV